jgi:hypothetical protein
MQSNPQPVKGSSKKSDDAPETVNYFISKLPKIRTDGLTQFIQNSMSLWSAAWEANLSTEMLEILIMTLSKLPYSSAVSCPSVLLIRKQVVKFLGSNSKKVTLVETCEIVLNAVRRILKFRHSNPSLVNEELEVILSTISEKLNMRDAEHRKISGKVHNIFEELEKPWNIKSLGPVNDEDIVDTVLEDCDWQNATVDWLLTPNLFCPALLPVMSGPGSVYESPEIYFDTMEKLWIGLTFNDGHMALSPFCRFRIAEKECGHALWPKNMQTLCSSKGCGNSRAFNCPMHQYGLCFNCNKDTIEKLIGPKSKYSGTHIYDAVVVSCDFTGNLYLKEFESRKAPQNIHWATTKRLSSPNLVGIVRVNGTGSTISKSEEIHWVTF